jgi:hypothetical protein
MKWTPWLLGSVTAALIAGCGGDRRNNDTGTAGGAETGTIQGGAATATDTATGTDTSGTATQRDTLSGNQTRGEGVTQTRPDQGQPVTSKGDTINPGGDSAGVNQ